MTSRAFFVAGKLSSRRFIRLVQHILSYMMQLSNASGSCSRPIDRCICSPWQSFLDRGAVSLAPLPVTHRLWSGYTKQFSVAQSPVKSAMDRSLGRDIQKMNKSHASVVDYRKYLQSYTLYHQSLAERPKRSRKYDRHGQPHLASPDHDWASLPEQAAMCRSLADEGTQLSSSRRRNTPSLPQEQRPRVGRRRCHRCCASYYVVRSARSQWYFQTTALTVARY